MRSIFYLLGFGLVALSPSRAFAERAAQDVVDVATIQDAEGNARFLLHWSPTIEAQNFTVGRATLVFDLAGEAEARSIPLHIYPLTTAWNAGDASWISGWTTPGGDFDASISSRSEIDLERGSGPVAVDMSSVVKEILEQKLPSYGYLLTTDPAEGIGFKSEDVSRFAGISNATIELTWRRVPPKPIELQQDDTIDGN